MKITILAAFAILTGCLDYIPSPTAVDPGASEYHACEWYTVPLVDTANWYQVDSTARCPDGDTPILYASTYLDTDASCPILAGFVVDGTIHRRFACHKGILE